jgi:ribonucleotide monophosphatase NagD (HAD superfamily)
MTGSKMVILSNSSRRASTTIEKLKSLGFDPSLFVGAITSGELTHQYLQRLTTIITNAQVILIKSILTMCGNLFILCLA